jgi:methionyl-tRNA formyltransferase
MRIAFFGTGEFGLPAFQALREAGHEIAVAISQPDRPAGRGLRIRPTAIHALADELGVPHVQTADVNGVELRERLAGVELGVVAAFGQKLGAALLAALPRGCVNVHGSLLPRYRGAAPHQWAIINGESVTGVTVFQLDERWDSGAIWSQRATPIGELETADELHDRLARLGAELLVEVLETIASGRGRPVPQDASQATRAPRLTRADAWLDWSQPAQVVVRRIHGLWSWPSATVRLVSAGGREERVQLARARVIDGAASPGEQAPPGAFLDDLSIQTGRGRLRLLELRPAGGRLMGFEDYARGRRIAPGDRLVPLGVE